MTKNHVGRPTNEEVAKRKKIKTIKILIPVAILVFIVGMILSKTGLTELMSNSTSNCNYVCNTGWVAGDNNTCYQKTTIDAYLLGDATSDGQITLEDYTIINHSINSNEELDTKQKLVYDLNQDGVVDKYDVLDIPQSSSGNPTIKTTYVCPKDKTETLEGATVTTKYSLNNTICDVIQTTPAMQVCTQDTPTDNINKNENANLNPVEISIKDDQNGKVSIKKDSIVEITPSFKINNKNQQYYYLWKTYEYNNLHYTSPCQKVIEGNIIPKSLTMFADRIGSFTIYSDNKCTKQIDQEVYTKKYSCDGCTNQVGINIDSKAKGSDFNKGKVVDLDVNFTINDTSKTYYYLWQTYNNNELSSTSDCLKVDSKNHHKTLTINGKRKGTISVYSDKKCKHKLKSKSTETYTCKNCNIKTFTIKYNSNGGKNSMSNQKIVYGKSTELRKNKFTKHNYYFLGWKVYNETKNKWLCYKNSAHTSQGNSDTSTCNKYGYVIYKDSQKVAQTAQKGETVVMYAHWIFNYKSGIHGFSGFEKSPKDARIWPLIKLTIYKNSNGTNSTNKTVPQAKKLKVLAMTNKNNSGKSYVKIKYNGTTGWIDGEYVMINLPDIIPSIVYNVTNAKASIYRNRSHNISGITGKDLYGSGWSNNMAPVRIPTAKKIQSAETTALKYGNRIKLYDAFRPYKVQHKIANAINTSWFTGKQFCVTNKFASNKNSNGNTRCFADSKGWFISTNPNPSSHTLAKAIDVTLVDKTTNQEIPTQSAMHELSNSAIPTETMVTKYPGELSLNSLFTNNTVGFYYLISEWWHFEDMSRTALTSKQANEVKNLGTNTIKN